MSGPSSDGPIGAGSDMVSRLRAVLPASWFPLTAPGAGASATPVLDGVLAGIGWGWAYCYALIQFVLLQTRISTATGSLLDMICADFFGVSVVRRTNEADTVFRSRIQANLLLPRATRSALSQTIATLLGRAPIIFEPFRAADTGGYGGATASSAGGGGGYGMPGMALGSSMMPFQYLVTIPSGQDFCRRESAASFIDGSGALQIAGRHVTRWLYTGAAASGVLAEPRGFNLIKDSVGWSSWPMASQTATARWTVDRSGAGAIWAGMPVMQVGIYSGGAIVGPAASVFATGAAVAGSIWLMLPADHKFQSCGITISDQLGGTAYGGADLAVVGQWQRLSATLGAAASSRLVSLTLGGQSEGLMNTPLLTQCWQIEPGSVATSYIPSSHGLGVREADDLASLGNAAIAVDQANLDQAIGRVIPAGSVAWTVVSS